MSGPEAYSAVDLRDLQPLILEICEKVKRDHPADWDEAHNQRDERSGNFNDLCVVALRERGIFAGRNGKRGDPSNRSDDILVFGRLDTLGAADRSGRFQSIAIIDFIGNAGGKYADTPTVPYLTWNDVSAAAPGYFLDPSGAVATPPPRPTPKPPPVADESMVIKAQLAALMEQQGVLMASLSNVPTRADLQAVKDELWGFLADKVIAEQFGDVRKMIANIQLPAGPRCNFPVRLRGSAAVLHAMEDIAEAKGE